jgi:hypothetical protein
MQGTVPNWCYAQGMTNYLYEHQIRIFDIPQWAEALRDAIRENVERIAAGNRTEIVFIGSQQEVPSREACPTSAGPARGRARSGVYLVGDGTLRQLQAVARPEAHKTYLKPDDGKCLHYYIYIAMATAIWPDNWASATSGIESWTTPSAGSPTLLRPRNWRTTSR